ncbi:GntR family transcriptional regulator [Actinoallomurus bryophytorum]|uniref:GntR family transcriptional regulator n=1 Tax=Actinoallomurus bryophytorum TaxID=1490222 RepID=A0A543CKX9_9ACTN|nr:GntR family transcriptional regulator [Actinoallomurus bryophytorum]TQL97753.1 GntR family transcriptional regulator [Actinoallomurus bryophytorum]
MAVSKWRSIADDLIKKIDGGEIARGAQLPTELELQVEYDASRNTVRDAIKWLTQRQLVVTHAGRGTFVSRKITPFAVELSPQPGLGPGGGDGSAYVASAQIQNRRPSTSDPRVEIRKATGLVARQLQIEEGARVVSRHQQRLIDDDPWSLQTSFYPMAFVNRGAERLVDAVDVEEGVVKYLEQELGLTQAGYQDLIAVRPPDQEESVFFDLPENASVTLIELSRTAYADSGEPIRFTVTVYPADRNLLYYNIGDVPEARIEVDGPA